MRGSQAGIPSRKERLTVAVHQSAANLIDALHELEPPENPTMDQLSTESGRLRLAERVGRRALVDELRGLLGR